MSWKSMFGAGTGSSAHAYDMMVLDDINKEDAKQIKKPTPVPLFESARERREREKRESEGKSNAAKTRTR